RPSPRCADGPQTLWLACVPWRNNTDGSVYCQPIANIFLHPAEALMMAHTGGPSLLGPLKKLLQGQSAVPLFVAGGVHKRDGSIRSDNIEERQHQRGLVICKDCHAGIHDLIRDEKELADKYHTKELLLANEAIKKHIAWVKNLSALCPVNWMRFASVALDALVSLVVEKKSQKRLGEGTADPSGLLVATGEHRHEEGPRQRRHDRAHRPRQDHSSSRPQTSPAKFVCRTVSRWSCPATTPLLPSTWTSRWPSTLGATSLFGKAAGQSALVSSPRSSSQPCR